MENIDASVLSTALPDIARDFGSDPIHLKLVLTSYLLALAVFIPASGWVADRFGARTVFRWAILVFALGSVACGLSTGAGATGGGPRAAGHRRLDDDAGRPPDPAPRRAPRRAWSRRWPG